MASPPDAKSGVLLAHACLNPHPERVLDPLFATPSAFFDPRDIVQVKYEMVRRVQIDGEPISHAAAAFGFSRPSFYEAQAALEKGGLAALIPKKRGPRHAHKLRPEIVAYLVQLLAEEPSLRAPELVLRVLGQFGQRVHPRSIERALARSKKK